MWKMTKIQSSSKVSVLMGAKLMSPSAKPGELRWKSLYLPPSPSSARLIVLSQNSSDSLWKDLIIRLFPQDTPTIKDFKIKESKSPLIRAKWEVMGTDYLQYLLWILCVIFCCVNQLQLQEIHSISSKICLKSS
jgi:hypothetical protein